MTEASQKFNPRPIEEDKRGLIYSLSSGSGGYKASTEKVKAFRKEGGTYSVKFISPGGSKDIAEGLERAEEAIEKVREEAPKRVNIGMPGSGKVELPDFDFDQIPEEP